MIVAVYLESMLWAPVNPVVRIERVTPLRRDSHQSGQQKNTFAQLLAAAVNAGRKESNGFDSKA